MSKEYDEWFSNWLKLMREYESKKQKIRIVKVKTKRKIYYIVYE